MNPTDRTSFHPNAVLSLLLSMLIGSGLHAATINVTTLSDLVGADGKCSLREAINNVNTHSVTVAGAGECVAGNQINDTIVLGAGTYPMAIVGASENNNASGDYDIRANVTIQGAGMDTTIIDANHLDRAFEINQNNLVVVIQDLSIINGRLNAHRGPQLLQDDTVSGGAIFLDHGTLGLLRVRLDSNQAGLGSTTNSSNSSGGDGGAIYADSCTLNIVDSVLSNNHSGVGDTVNGDDGYGGNGGAIAAVSCTISIQGSRFTGNQSGDASGLGAAAGNGGALALDIVHLTIDNSAFDDNATGTGATPREIGGAMYLGTDAAALIAHSSVTRNVADTGGGIYSGSNNNVTMSNATVSDNTASTVGGGMYFDSLQAQLDFVTVTANNAPTAAGIAAKNTFHNTPGVVGNVSFRNSIISGNPGGGAGCAAVDAFSSFTTQGHNIIGGGCPNTGPGDVATTNPGLGALTDNGGIGLTHMPRPTSPATDAGSCSASGINDDQRAHARPADVPRVSNVADACDIGALELDDDIFWNGAD